ncbi:uncharacterized protein B0I36DRAFT_385853 [Microdochium trichocladiopsis]|uniref:Cell wall mannoprotein PIR1-like C-terminal domain-containing protein n=1 Tax=Microdochium trichocladiopsis TaxID=1682393 RepID=A0A9P8Y2D9_9PEZI|nr:uncharacterized protein B0I36DRAFT_385853 [Microdochium trichocladiopsis]KAH7027930.1 hypothetical protein B0I36DRAFT_385853 [Microdochium trichocladiopsis]
MRYSSAVSSAIFIGAAIAAPQGVTEDIAPSGGPPSGCSTSYDGTFEITIGQAPSAKRDLEERATCGSTAGSLIVSLKNGNLLDAQKRTGYIAANYQFQFDGPAQTGAIYTSGFSVCQDNSLALGSSKTWYRCLSGDFYNLYDRNWAPQCEKVSILIMPCTGSGGGAGSGGNVVGTTMVPTTVVTQLGDGQPQVVSTMVPKPITQISDGQVQAPPGAPVTQISDGQVQAPSPIATKPAGPPVSQISDGQVQAPTHAPVTQISDGQVQAPTGAPVTQISDGQIQAPPGTVAPPASTTRPATIPISGASSMTGSFGAFLFGLVATFFAL